MSLNKVGGRFILKKANKSGEIPTISAYNDHTSGKWISTDIYDGEIYINTFDNRMWFRNSNNQIIEIPVLSTDTLKILDKYLPNMYGKLNYMGIWKSDKYPLNPLRTDYYIMNIDCIIDGIEYHIGDFIIYNGKNWDKVDNYKKIIYTTDVIYNDELKLNDIILNILEYENRIITKSLIIKDDVEILNVNKNDIKYKNETIYHSGNSNNEKIDWIANNIKSNIINTIQINTSNIITDSILVKEVINFNDNTYILGNAKGLSINVLNKNIFEYKTFNNNIVSNVKMKYNNNNIFENELDIVDKKYVDNQINKTYNIDVNENVNNVHRIEKNIKYINIDINSNNVKIELIVDDLENDNSSLIILCLCSSDNKKFNLNIKSSNKDLIKINKLGIVSLYFNSKNKKWYKIS